MMIIPQTSDSYDLKSIGDWRQYWDKKFKEKFGDDADMSDDQFLGMISAILSEGTYMLDQLGYSERNSLLPQFAIGKQLDDAVGQVGITRHQSSPSYVTLKIIGYYDTDNPTIIESGDQFATPDNHVFTVIDGKTINSAGTTKDENGNDQPLQDDDGNPLGAVMVEAYSEDNGIEANVLAHTIVNPITSIDGFYSVDNPDGATGGQDEETDEHLRSRYFFQNTAYAPGSKNNIESQILNIAGVQDCRLIPNRSPKDTDVYGNPPKSSHLYVIGGDEKVIAQTYQDQLYQTTLTMGDIPVTTKDVNGQEEITNFDRAKTATIYINIDLDIDDQTFNQDTEPNKIKKSIMDYFSTLKMGATVMNNRLYSLVFIDGVNNANISSGLDKEKLSSSDIKLDDFFLPQVNEDTITVNINKG